LLFANFWSGAALTADREDDVGSFVGTRHTFRLDSELGYKVIVAHAQKVQLITKSNRKDDRHDARTLARLARIDPELLAYSGDTARAKELADELARQFPEDTVVQFIQLPWVFAQLALNRKDS
jgi:hypothetical protein